MKKKRWKVKTKLKVKKAECHVCGFVEIAGACPQVAEAHCKTCCEAYAGKGKWVRAS